MAHRLIPNGEPLTTDDIIAKWQSEFQVVSVNLSSGEAGILRTIEFVEGLRDTGRIDQREARTKISELQAKLRRRSKINCPNVHV